MTSGDSSAKTGPGSQRARPSAPLTLGGLTPLSASDYPGRLAVVLFCRGCPWRCGYCHNAHLQDASSGPELSWADAEGFLRRRVGLAEAVVFSGGEPTAQSGLGEAMRRARELGFLVGLHTAGPYPQRLAEVLPLADWVGLDVKAPFDEYEAVTGVPDSGGAVRESLRRLLAFGVDHECRTTVHPARLDAARLERLTDELWSLGVRRHALQAFRAVGCVDGALNAVDAAATARLIESVRPPARAPAGWLLVRA